MVIRDKSNNPTLSKFILANLYSIMATIRIGHDILTERENIEIKEMSAHGGVFKTKEVMQNIVASSLNTKISLYDSASEGGSWGIACLALYLDKKDEYESLDDFLEKVLFSDQVKYSKIPDEKIVKSFEVFIITRSFYLYKNLLMKIIDF